MHSNNPSLKANLDTWGYIAESATKENAISIMTTIIDFTISSFPNKTQSIILDYWSDSKIKHFKELSVKYNCSMYDIMRHIQICSVFRKFKVRYLKEVFIEVSGEKRKPITGKLLNMDKIKGLKYPTKFYLNIFSFLFEDIHFKGCPFTPKPEVNKV